MIHYKKLTQPYFNDVWKGEKNFELRKNDCNYQVGDLVVLQEYDAIRKVYLGREIEAVIDYMLENYLGIKEGYCILSIKVTDRRIGFTRKDIIEL